VQFPGFRSPEIIAQSKSSLVLRALRDSDGQPVILKTSSKDYPSAADIARLKTEYEICKSFDHPGLVKSLELVPFRAGYIFVMEDIGGRALSQDLQGGPLSIPLFLDYATKISDALAYIHRAGVIHKDIKPANIVHNPQIGRLYIIDFSIASKLSRERQKAVGFQAHEGSLQYMSPEQTGRMNRPVDYRSDFYSLGVAFYEMLTGRLPFLSKDPMELVHCHLARPPEPIHSVQPAVPRALSDIVSRLMAKTAEERYQSAHGLMADLQHCQSEWSQHGQISIFDLGLSDQLSHFQIPNKLYGREPEIDKMLEIFEQTCQGGTEMILVSGYSGVGKSALVEEIHKPIVARHGYFIESKFDQYRRDIPYLAISQAFGGLIRQLMAEPEERVSSWKQRLLAVLDSMGQVIIDVIPEVQLLIGEQPAVVPLEGKEAQNRFISVFEKFLGVFTSKDHPLVFFVDDLQWADVTSLRLFEAIMTPGDCSHLLILGAYRDNEVSASHPLMLSLDKIRERKPLHEIRLAPLSLEHTSQLVADMFHASPSSVIELAKLVHVKTHGNPFFLGQLLMSLYDQGLIRYSFAERKWLWDLGQIQLAGVSDQVVDLMTAKIRKLSIDVQELLKLASCLGNNFDAVTLATISSSSIQRVLQLLFLVVQEGLVLALDESFKYFVGADSGTLAPSDNFRFKFLHDRVHEAAYSLMSAERRKEVHLRIGQDLRDSLSSRELEERIFDVVNHLNLGAEYLHDLADREELAELNLMAGMKARASSANSAARDYLARGVTLMGPEPWARHYETMFQLYRNLTECEYLCGRMDRAEELFDITLANARNRQDKANAYELMMNAYMKYGRFIEGVQFGRRALRMYGIELPEDPASFQRVLDEEFKAIERIIAGRSIEELEQISASADEDLTTSMSLLHQTWNNSYFAEGLYDHGTIAALRIATLSLTKGYTSYTPFGYVTYGLNLSSVFGQYDKGYQFGMLAVRLQRKYNNIHLVAKINNLFAHFISHYKRGFKHSIPHYEDSYHACLQTGDLWYGLWAVNFIPHVRFIKGDTLDEVYRDALKYHDYAEKSRNDMMFQLLNMDEHMILNLQGKLRDRRSFNSDHYDEASMVAMLKAIPFDFGLFWYDLYKSFVLYLDSDIDLAWAHSLSAEKNKTTAPGLMLFVEQHFYHSLIICARFDRMTDAEKERYLAVLEENAARLSKWGAHCPENYSHKHLLVQAEMMRIRGNTLAALDLYEKAAEDAGQMGALHNAAIANELAGKLMLAGNHPQAARGYLVEAIYFYDRWGASRIVKERIEQYKSWALPVQASSMPTTLTSTAHSTSSTTEMLDLMTVLKASQTLSSEIVLNELLRKLLGIVFESAGAEKGALLLEKNGEWAIVVEGSVRGGINVVPPYPFSSATTVCAAVINYVLKTGENVVLDEAKSYGLFSSDAYISSSAVKSLLCIPITYHNRLSALLYLENNLVSKAFTPDRLSVLRMLSTQVAISMENAQLYANLEEYNQRLAEKVEERTRELNEKNQQLKAKNEQILRTQQQLVTQEKMASLGTLTAGVAHEINNPSNFVNGSSQNLLRDLKHFEKFLYELAGDEDKEVVEVLRKNMQPLFTHVQIIMSGTDRIRAIVRDLQTFSRHNEAELKVVELVTGITSTINLVRSSYQDLVHFETNFRDPVEIECQPAELNQVFMNIIVNGCQAIAKRSANEPQHKGILRIETWRDGALGFMSFTDNGCGMSATVQEKIFEPFFSTKPVGEGTGLGLYISYGIIHRHRGEIRVQSSEGAGACFTIVLPIRQIHP